MDSDDAVKLTAVLMSWKRLENVRHIVSGLIESGHVDEILVADAGGSLELAADPRVTVARFSQDPGLYARFAMACLARNPAVLVQDDDIYLPQETIGALLRHWRGSRDVIHGLYGRDARDDGTYARETNLREGESRVVLTRALVCGREHFGRFFECCRDVTIEQAQQDAVPRGNGEDMILSYTASKYSGKKNRVHALRRTELPAPHAIHGRASHWAHRTRLMRVLEEWLART